MLCTDLVLFLFICSFVCGNVRSSSTCNRIETEMSRNCITEEAKDLQDLISREEDDEKIISLKCNLFKRIYKCANEMHRKYVEVTHCRYLNRAREGIKEAERLGCVSTSNSTSFSPSKNRSGSGLVVSAEKFVAITFTLIINLDRFY
ncbi:Uncharacterised protein g2710 [Pycnogonum litorale]